MEDITVKNISYVTDGKELLQDIHFSVQKGETFALIGENGAGKSTLIDVILGDLKPSAGEVSFLGLKKNSYAGVGVVYDQLPLFPMLTVEESIRYFAALHKLNYKEIEKEYFDVFEIDKIKKSFIKKLSQGEKKRVGILLAVMHDPELIILDEPFAHLDPTIIGKIWKAIRGQNRTVLYSTHNWKEVGGMASQIGFLYQGKLLMSPESPKKLLSNLPADKKITLTYTGPEMNELLRFPGYLHNDLLHLFFDPKSDQMATISKYTINFSVQDVDLSDVYLYHIHKIEENESISPFYKVPATDISAH